MKKHLSELGTAWISIVPSEEYQGEYQQQVCCTSLGSIELCTDEYIYKSNHKWYKHKVWDKIESYADEEIETDYISTTGELSEGATVYYKVDETDEEITDETLVAQLEKLYNSKTYRTITSIYTETDNLSPELEVEYVLDLKTYIDNKISAIST